MLGVGVHALNMQTAVAVLLDAARRRSKGYVCVTGAHGIMEAQRDANFRRLLNRSLLTTPDGMPAVWIGRLQGYANIDRVYGPDLMLDLCAASVAEGLTHFLYGGNSGVADELKTVLERRFPGIQVIGTYTPPFRPLDRREQQGLAERVRALRPDFFWVGLSTPKQEHFMAEYLSKLETTVMIGVGAAFDIHTGKIQDSPQWIKRSGLQWLHRLVQEPRRLWRRYLINNPKFVYALLLQASGARRYTVS